MTILYTTAAGSPASASFSTDEGAWLFTGWLDDEGLGWERVEG